MDSGDGYAQETNGTWNNGHSEELMNMTAGPGCRVQNVAAYLEILRSNEVTSSGVRKTLGRTRSSEQPTPQWECHHALSMNGPVVDRHRPKSATSKGHKERTNEYSENHKNKTSKLHLFAVPLCPIVTGVSSRGLPLNHPWKAAHLARSCYAALRGQPGGRQARLRSLRREQLDQGRWCRPRIAVSLAQRRRPTRSSSKPQMHWTKKVSSSHHAVRVELTG